MGRMFRRIALGALFIGLLCGTAQAQSFNKKKPKTTLQVWSSDDTGISIPGEQYGTYVWRQVQACKAKWFSDGQLKSCEGIEGTERWRLESNGDFAERVFWDPGPGPEPDSQMVSSQLLYTKAGGKVTLVSLPSGKKTVTDYSGWVEISTGHLLGGGYYLTGPEVEGQPVTLSKLHLDGTVDAPVPGSDYNRIVQSVSASACPFNSAAAALPAENALAAIPGTPWTELRRMEIVDGVVGPSSADIAGDASTRCGVYENQFYLARRASDGAWSVIGTDGAVYSLGATYPTAEAAQAAVPDVLDATGQRTEVAQAEQAERDRLAAERATADAAAEAEAERVRLAQRAADQADIRAKARALLAARQYEEAANQASGLDTGEWATYVLAWRDAPVSVYEEAVRRLDKDPDSSADYKPWESKAALERRIDGINKCNNYGFSIRNAPSNNRWLRTPKNQRWLEINAMRQGIDMSPQALGQHLVFDATAYEWVWVSYSAPGDVINIPTEIPDAPEDTAALARCEQEARARD